MPNILTGTTSAIANTRGTASLGNTSENLLVDKCPTSCFFALSLRRLSNKYTGFCIRVRRNNGDELDIGFIEDSLDVASLLNFVGSGDASVTRWYSQINNHVFSQSTLTLQPKIVVSGVLQKTSTGNPTLVFNNTCLEIIFSTAQTSNKFTAYFSGTLNSTANLLNARILSCKHNSDGNDFSGSSAIFLCRDGLNTQLKNLTGGGTSLSPSSIQYNTEFTIASIIQAKFQQIFLRDRYSYIPTSTGGVTVSAHIFRIGASAYTLVDGYWQGNINEILLYTDNHDVLNKIDSIYLDIDTYYKRYNKSSIKSKSVNTQKLPLDKVSPPLVALSLRKLISSYIGFCIRVRRSSDNAEQDIGFVNDYLDIASLLSFCGSSSGFVVKWYNQSSNYEFVQATAAQQPTIVSAGAIATSSCGKAAIYFNLVHFLELILPSTINLPNATTYGFCNIDSGSQNAARIFASTINLIQADRNVLVFLYRSQNRISFHRSGNEAFASFTYNQDFSVATSYYGQGFSWVKNPVETSTSTSQSISIYNFTIGCNAQKDTSVEMLKGYVSELLLYSTKHSYEDANSIKKDIDSYYDSTYLLDKYPGAAVAYGLRKLRLNYSGACIRVRRSSDNAERDIGFIGSELDQQSLLNFVGSGTGFIAAWYDQSGSGVNAYNSFTTTQPIVVANKRLHTSKNRPAIRFVGNKDLGLVFDDLPSDYTIFCIYELANFNSLASNQQILSFGNWYFFGYPNAAGGTTGYSIAQGNWKTVPAVIGRQVQVFSLAQGTGTSKIFINNNQRGNNLDYPTRFALGNNVRIGSGNVGINYLDGFISEMIIYKSVFSDTNRNNMTADIISYHELY